MVPAAICALVAGAIGLAACDDAQVVDQGGETATSAEATLRGSDTPSVDCGAAIVDRVDPTWRSRSVVSGRFGLYGDSGDLRTADRWGRDAYWTKIPVILDGHRAAMLRVASRDRHRVGLTYGPDASSPGTSTDGADSLTAAPREMRFVPCQDRSPSAWPGGLILSDRKTVSLRVRVNGGRWRSLSIQGATLSSRPHLLAPASDENRTLTAARS